MKPRKCPPSRGTPDYTSRICAHYLTHDKVDDVSFVDGKAVFPDNAVASGLSHPQTRRIIIYQEFSSMALLLQNVNISPMISFVSDAITI